MSEQGVSRREFLRSSTGAAAGVLVGAAGVSSVARAAPKGTQFVVGMIGCGGRGTFLADELLTRKNIEIAYVCDPDRRRMETMVRDHVQKQTGKAPQMVGDFRTILDNRRVHAVFNATPDHWHALPTILACQAEKDVYVEKPASHSIWEGRKMVEAARKYRRIVQLGTQTRSGRYTREAVEYLRAGKLGKVHLVRVLNMKQRDSIGHKQDDDSAIPPGVNYDMWLGPAPKRKFNPNRFHYAWHWFWDYSGGDIINDGVHQIDAARWLLGKDYPQSVSATGGRFALDDDQETPDTHVVTWDFGDATMVFEMTLWTPYMKKMPWELRDGDTYPNWQSDGMKIEVFGEKGLMFFERHGGGWQVFDASEKVIAQANDRHPHYAHLDNFFDCIESRKLPNADIEEGHRSTILCHLGNISLRVGGRKLEFDGKTERFINDDQANGYLKRVYRDPWIVPEQV